MSGIPYATPGVDYSTWATYADLDRLRPDSDPRRTLDVEDLTAVLNGDDTRPEPTILRRDDRQALFYPGQVNGMFGDSGTGKSFLAAFAVVQQITAGRKVVYIDLEDVPSSIISRLRLLGARDEDIRHHFGYIRPVDPLDDRAVTELLDIVTRNDPSLVFVDSLGEAFGLEGINENNDAEVRPWMRRVLRPIADLGPAVVFIDHVTKAGHSPLHPSGTKGKRAAIGGALYLLEATESLAAGKGGRVKLTCAKDRHGWYARAEVVGSFVMTAADAPGGTRTELYAPGDLSPQDRGDYVAGKILEVIEDSDGPISQATLFALLREKKKVQMADTKLRDKLTVLIDEGEVVATKGDRGAIMYDVSTSAEQA